MKRITKISSLMSEYQFLTYLFSPFWTDPQHITIIEWCVKNREKSRELFSNSKNNPLNKLKDNLKSRSYLRKTESVLLLLWILKDQEYVNDFKNALGNFRFSSIMMEFSKSAEEIYSLYFLEFVTEEEHIQELLTHSIQKFSISFCNKIIEKGADINYQDDKGNNYFRLFPEKWELILSLKIDPTIKNKNGKDGVMKIIKNRDYQVVSKLLESDFVKDRSVYTNLLIEHRDKDLEKCISLSQI